LAKVPHIIEHYLQEGVFPVIAAFFAISLVRLVAAPNFRPAPTLHPPRGILISFDWFQEFIGDPLAKGNCFKNWPSKPIFGFYWILSAAVRP
jgi:hypothetical protein